MSPSAPVCLVTGSATGIGAACAREFAQRGWHVGIGYLDDGSLPEARAVAADCANAGVVAWLHTLVRAHLRVTHGEPRLVRVDGRMQHDEQAFVSWLCLAWAVLALCQLAVTVAGNLAVIPLTGVTFPFVSFGMASLLMNMAMLGLGTNVNKATA